MEVHQGIEHQPIEQLEQMVSTPTPEEGESGKIKKKEVNVRNSKHKDEFNECMESCNMHDGADYD